MLNDLVNSEPSGPFTHAAITLVSMEKTRRKPLEPWQREDAARLKALYDATGREAQEKFGARYGIGSQALVWQYLNGYIPLNLKVAIKFAVGINCKVADFSPTLAAELPADNAPHDPGFTDLLKSLPLADAQQVLDFISYKFERAEGLVASDRMASYARWVERISKDLADRKKADGEP